MKSFSLQDVYTRIGAIGTRVGALERLKESASNSGGVLPIGSSAGWQRRTVPLISATAGWEGSACQEPCVRYESGTWKMWYTGSFNTPGMGYASCISDPTVPANWTKYAGNPVLGQGGSGVAGWVSGSNVFKDGSTYYCFYYDTVGGGNLKASTSTDGLSWTAPTTAIASGAVAGCYGWANSFAWNEGSTWKMLVEGSTTSGAGHGPPWAVWYFTASSPAGPWTVGNGGSPLSSLAISGYTMGYGQGPNFAEIDGVTTPQIGGSYVLWCHVSAISSSIVSNIMHASSADAISWSPASGFDLVADRGAYETDQAADASVLEVAGVSYLFYDGVDNGSGVSFINLATYDGTLVDLLNQVAANTGFASAESLASDTTTSTSYVALGGPSVTIEIGSNGIALVGFAMQSGAAQSLMSIEVTGANSIVATDDHALYNSVTNFQYGRTHVFTGLASGSTTFTAKYRVISGTGTFLRRSLWALAL